VKIDPNTGAVISDGFGSGVGYVEITGGGLLGDVDDIASDPLTGLMYGVSNTSGAGGVLFLLNLSTGTATVICSLGVDDIEGLAFDSEGILYGSTGNDFSSDRDKFWRINKATGTATEIGSFGFPDIEALACPIGSCGNGILEFDEGCDDGNIVDGDGCAADCAIPVCGDGVMDAGEECDDCGANSDTNPDACRVDCTLPGCGDGVVDSGDECDDGNQVDGDGCNSLCEVETCGNGVLNAGEACDDANASNADGCLNNCTIAACGDGFVEAGFEGCDDGNALNTDGCLTDCSAASCGDGFTQSGVEGCDDGNATNTDACLNDCTVASCGDGTVQAGVEDCDDGNATNTDACLNDCSVASCGDGVEQSGVEGCDDGNVTPNDGCDASCFIEVSEPADLSVTKSDSPDAVIAGMRLGYSITAINNGPGVAVDAMVLDILDPSTTLVSATGTGVDCSVLFAGMVSCSLGSLAAGEFRIIDITTEVDVNAPTSGILQAGACTGAEDLCNRVVISSDTVDPNPANNQDDEPTNVLPSGGSTPGDDCGNGTLDPGEQCDIPSSEDCSNLFDDDGDGLVDCVDPDCLTGVPTCSLSCVLVPTCQPILDDPAIIKFGRNGRLDMISIHARFEPLTPVDFYTDNVEFSMSNAGGVFFRTALYPGDMKSNKKGTSWKFKDKGARSGLGSRSGMFKFKVKSKLMKGVLTYPFTIKAYGDFSRARVPLMTTQMAYGDDNSTLTAEWEGEYGKSWLLRRSNLPGN
ncbi:MAG: putative repeat protein (TIGR01451 family), partial [Candidatus Binatia bacterium]